MSYPYTKQLGRPDAIERKYIRLYNQFCEERQLLREQGLNSTESYPEFLQRVDRNDSNVIQVNFRRK